MPFIHLNGIELSTGTSPKAVEINKAQQLIIKQGHQFGLEFTNLTDEVTYIKLSINGKHIKPAGATYLKLEAKESTQMFTDGGTTGKSGQGWWARKESEAKGIVAGDTGNGTITIEVHQPDEPSKPTFPDYESGWSPFALDAPVFRSIGPPGGIPTEPSKGVT